jgi:hypothetical protein
LFSPFVHSEVQAVLTAEFGHERLVGTINVYRRGHQMARETSDRRQLMRDAEKQKRGMVAYEQRGDVLITASMTQQFSLDLENEPGTGQSRASAPCAVLGFE